MKPTPTTFPTKIDPAHLGFPLVQESSLGTLNVLFVVPILWHVEEFNYEPDKPRHLFGWISFLTLLSRHLMRLNDGRLMSFVTRLAYLMNMRREALEDAGRFE
jgi:hypothetical protein